MNVLLISSSGVIKGGRREDLVLVDMAPTRQWYRKDDSSVMIHDNVEREICDAVMACCEEHGWHMEDKGTEGIRRMGEDELRDVIPWTVLTPLDEEELSPDEVMEHVSTAPIWQIPPRIVAFACPSRSQAKSLAKAIQCQNVDRTLNT